MLTKNALLALCLLPVFILLRQYHESLPLLNSPQVILRAIVMFAIAILGYHIIIRMGVPPVKSSLTLFLPGFSLLVLDPLNRFLTQLIHNNAAANFQFLIPVWIILNVLVIRKLLVMNTRLFKSALLVNLAVILLVMVELFLGIKNSTETRRNNMAVSAKNSLGITVHSKVEAKSGKQSRKTSHAV